MKLFLIFIFCLMPTAVFANSCTTSGGSGSGNWDTAGVWTSCGGTFPHNADTFVITTGVTVTVENTLTATWGTSGATGTIGGTINQGGTLVIASGGTMNGRDTLTLQRGSTLTISGGGTYNFNCPDGSTCLINLANAGSGSVNFNVGTSGTFGNLVNVPQGTTGLSKIDLSTNGSDTIINWNGFLLSGVGSATVRALDAPISPASPHSTTFENGVVLNSGEINITNNNAASNFIVSHVDFRNCADVSASSNGNTCLNALAASVATTGVRTFSYLTAYNTAIKNIWLDINGGQCGAAVIAGDGSDIQCFTALNTGFRLSGTTPFTMRTVFITTDLDVSPYIGVVANTTSNFQNSIVFGHNGNQHEFGSTTSGASLGANTISYNVCDGDGFMVGDAGDFVNSDGPSTISYNINIASCGTLITAAGAGTVDTMLHNTSYQSYAGSVGEGGGGATQVAGFRNNLIISPSNLNIAVEQGGLWQPSAFITQTMAAGALDYNGFFGTMNATNLTNATLGGVVSYMGPESVHPWFTSSTYGTTAGYGTHDLHVNPNFVDSTRTICTWYNSNGGYANCPSTVARLATAGTTTTTIFCSTCNFTTEAIGTNDFVRLDNGGSYLGQAQVTVVNSSTQITISPAITGLASGTTFSFITDVIGIAKAMVTVNGYDFQGNAITPVSWATTANALSYIRAGFAPTNVALHNAGSDGTDIGAVALSSSVTFLVSPGNTDTVFEGAVRTVYGNVCSAVQSQGCTPPANVTIAWVTSCGTLSSSSGPWVTWTAPNSTGTCTVTGTAAAGGSPATQTYVVIADAVSVNMVPFYSVLYENQIALLQPIVAGSTTKTVTWSGGAGGTLTTTSLTAKFSSATPGTYTVTATSVADGTKSASAKIIVTTHAIPSSATPNRTEPVDCTAEGSGTTYTVSTNADLDAVPWKTLGPGDTIIVNYNATPYARQFILGYTTGSATQPIRICGVPDPTNGLPVFSGSGASSVTAFNNPSATDWAGTVGNGIQQFGCCIHVFDHAHSNGSTSPNGYILIEGLKFEHGIDATDSGSDSPGFTFFPVEAPSTPTVYSKATSCVRIQNGHDIVIRGNELFDCGNGIFSNDGEDNGSRTTMVLLEGNYMHQNSSTSGSQTNHNAYMQGTGLVVQGNYMGPNRTGGTGAIIKTRFLSKYIRYNYMTIANPASTLDFVEPENLSSPGPTSIVFTAIRGGLLTAALVAANEELYNGGDYVYGNIFNNQSGGGSFPIIYGADDGPGECPDGKLWFYYNTWYDQTTNYRLHPFGLQALGQACSLGGGINGTNPGGTPTGEAADNAFWLIQGTEGVTVPFFFWTRGQENRLQVDKNWVPASWCVLANQSLCGMVGADGSGVSSLQYVAYQGGDNGTQTTFNPNIAGALVTGSVTPFNLSTYFPVVSSPLIGAAASLPAAISNLPVNMEYNPSTFLMMSRPNASDIGALPASGVGGPTGSIVSVGTKITVGVQVQ